MIRQTPNSSLLESVLRKISEAEMSKTARPLFSEQCKDLQFTDLEQDMQMADQAAVATPHSMRARAKLAFQTAMFRDAFYGHAGRAYYRSLGVKNELRGAYDTTKPSLNAGL